MFKPKGRIKNYVNKEGQQTQLLRPDTHYCEGLCCSLLLLWKEASNFCSETWARLWRRTRGRDVNSLCFPFASCFLCTYRSPGLPEKIFRPGEPRKRDLHYSTQMGENADLENHICRMCAFDSAPHLWWLGTRLVKPVLRGSLFIVDLLQSPCLMWRTWIFIASLYYFHFSAFPNFLFVFIFLLTQYRNNKKPPNN